MAFLLTSEAHTVLIGRPGYIGAEYQTLSQYCIGYYLDFSFTATRLLRSLSNLDCATISTAWTRPCYKETRPKPRLCMGHTLLSKNARFVYSFIFCMCHPVLSEYRTMHIQREFHILYMPPAINWRPWASCVDYAIILLVKSYPFTFCIGHPLLSEDTPIRRQFHILYVPRTIKWRLYTFV
jgi:hypothetical protein